MRRDTPLNTGVKLCTETSSVGRPSACAAVELGRDPVVVGPEDSLRPCCSLGLADSWLPGITVSSLIFTIEVGTPGSRLQSITSRE